MTSQVSRWQSPFMGASRGGRVTSRRAAFWSETFSCFVQTQHVELKPCLVGVHMVFHLWHVQYDKEKWWCLYSLCAMVGANLTCSTETVFDLMVCPWRFTFEIYNFLIVIMRFTQCAQCFVQIPHVQVKPCLVVCTWCFAQTGLTLRGWVNFTLNACAHGVGWLNAGWVDLTSAPSTLVFQIDLSLTTMNALHLAKKNNKHPFLSEVVRDYLSEKGGKQNMRAQFYINCFYLCRMMLLWCSWIVSSTLACVHHKRQQHETTGRYDRRLETTSAVGKASRRFRPRAMKSTFVFQK